MLGFRVEGLEFRVFRVCLFRESASPLRSQVCVRRERDAVKTHT